MAEIISAEWDHMPPDGAPGAQGEDVPRMKKNKLDTPESLAILHQIQSWWLEARDLHAANRAEQFVDADYYDNIQDTLEELERMRERGQPPLVFNILAQMCDWLIGTERRTRIDWNVRGRTQEDVDIAEIKKQTLKYVSDVENAEFERSEAFEDDIKVGVGWVEEFVRNDPTGDLIGFCKVPWPEVWWDPYSRRNDLGDARYLHRARWTDLDQACAAWPERTEVLKMAAASTMTDGSLAYSDPMDVPSMFLESTSSPGYRGSLIADGSGAFAGSAHLRERNRVRIIQTWFRRPVAVKRVISELDEHDENKINGATLVAENGVFNIPPHLQSLIETQHVTLIDAVEQQVWIAFWVEGHLLQLSQSPFKHKRFGLTPCWCYRRSRDGMPYGVIRRARDPQDFFNQRMRHAHLLMVTRQVVAEDGAVAEENEQDVLDNVADPRGFIRVRAGALTNKQFEIRENAQFAPAHVEMAKLAQDHTHNALGVNRENLGQQSNAQSGKAIIARQQEGAVQTAAIFDNLRMSIQYSGEKLLSLIEQYMSENKVLRVTGSNGKSDFISINEPEFNPLTGKWHYINDVTATQSDFVVDQQDFRETLRMAMAETFMALVAGMPPEIALVLLDLAVEMMDLPNKEAIAERIRSISGQMPAGQEQTPEAIAQRQAKAEAEQRQAQLAEAERTAKIEKDRGSAAKAFADAEQSKMKARREKVQGQAEAMNAAAVVKAAPDLTPGADRMWGTPEQVPGNVAPPDAP